MATLAVVGPGMANTPGVVPRVFAALSEAGINVVSIAQGSSELNLSVVVQGADAAKAQQQIHDQFQLAKIGGGAHATAPHTDVVLLGFGKVGRQLARLIAQRNGTPPALRAMAVLDTTGFVFDPKGLSRRRLTEIAAAKGRGEPLSGLPGGRAGDALGALNLVGRHALSRPVLVDCTAAETAREIAQLAAAFIDARIPHREQVAIGALGDGGAVVVPGKQRAGASCTKPRSGPDSPCSTRTTSSTSPATASSASRAPRRGPWDSC